MPPQAKLRKKKIGKTTYWFTEAGGATYFGSVDAVPFSEARNLFNDRIKSLSEGTNDSKSRRRTAGQLMDIFLDWISRNRSTDTYESRRTGCSRFGAFHVGQQKIRDLPANKVKSDDLAAFLEHLDKDLPIGLKPTFISLRVARVKCFACDIVRQVKVGFADPKKHYTRSFERYALELSKHMTIDDVAQHLQVSWDTIKDIQASNLKRRFGKPKLRDLKEIAIDEIAVSKGHRYLTVVLNLRSGVIVFVGDGKGVDSLKPFWKRLRHARAKIRAVATDMSSAYIRAVRDNLPNAAHVFDHFHVLKLFNDKLSAFRRELYHQATPLARLPQRDGD